MTKTQYVIDGTECKTLKETAAAFTRALGLNFPWNGNLDALNDILRGGFGTPEDGFVLIWKQSDLSRQGLGYNETVRWYEENLQKCHPTNVSTVKQKLSEARNRRGTTVFDWLVEIIRGHQNIELRLC